MKCPNCNKEIADNTKFCPECGHNFSQPQQETPVQPQPQLYMCSNHSLNQRRKSLYG